MLLLGRGLWGCCCWEGGCVGVLLWRESCEDVVGGLEGVCWCIVVGGGEEKLWGLPLESSTT